MKFSDTAQKVCALTHLLCTQIPGKTGKAVGTYRVVASKMQNIPLDSCHFLAVKMIYFAPLNQQQYEQDDYRKHVRKYGENEGP